MTKFSKLKIIILFSIFYFLFSSTATLAARLNLVSQTQEVGMGQQFQVDLMLDAERQDINAVESKIIFPANLLEIKEIYDGNSIINFWVEKPHTLNTTNTSTNNREIVFSGVIPGGFSGVLSPYYKGGKPGKVFSVVFVAKKEGSGIIEIHDAKVLLNDGKGTPANTQISNFQFSVTHETTRIGTPIDTKKDTDPPELFTPEVTSDPSIFDGKWFLVFAAQDKGSGVDYYVIHESTRIQDATRINTNDWIEAESPYLLKDQKLQSYIYVKAVDKAGNERFVVLPPKFAPWYKKWPVYIIVGLIGLIVLLLIVRWLWQWIYTKKHKY